MIRMDSVALPFSVVQFWSQNLELGDEKILLLFFFLSKVYSLLHCSEQFTGRFQGFLFLVNMWGVYYKHPTLLLYICL